MRAEQTHLLSQFVLRLRSDPATGRMLWGVLWGLMSRLSPFLSLAICARLLGAEKFGAIAAMYVLVGVAVSLAGLGLQILGVRLVSEALAAGTPVHDALGRSVAAAAVISSIAAMLVLTFPTTMSLIMFGDNHLRDQVRWSSLWIFAAMLNPVLSGLLLSLDRKRSLFLFGLVQSVLIITLMPLAALRFGIEAALGVQGGVGVVGALIALRGLGLAKLSRPTGRGLFSDARLILQCVVPSAVGGVAWTWSQTLAIGFVSRSAGSLEPIGEFALAQQIFTVASFLPLSAAIGLAPLLFRAHAAGDAERASTLIRWSLAAAALYGTLACALIFSVAPPLAALFGGSFYDAVGDIRVMAPVIFLASLHGFMGHFTQATNRYWQWALVNFVSGFANIVTVFALYRHIDDVLAWGWLAAFIAGVAAAMPLTLYHVRRRPRSEARYSRGLS